MIKKIILLMVVLLSVMSMREDAFARGENDGYPLEIKLSLPKTGFVPNEEMITSVTYKNVSKEPVRVLKLVGWGYPLTFDIVDSRDRHSAVIKMARKQFYERTLMTLAGTPTAVVRGGISLITTAPAPTMASSPMVIRLIMTAPVCT